MTRGEIISGRRVVAQLAHPPRGTRHSKLSYVLQSHVAPGHTVAVLLDDAIADKEVAEALAAKGNPVIRRLEDAARNEGEAKGRVEGRAEGKAESILRILELRGVSASKSQRQKVLRCRDLELLDRWFGRALQAASTDEVTSES